MKNILYKALFALTICSFADSISAQEIINYFEVANNIAKPVTIKTPQGTYSIYGGERIVGNLYWLEAYDANGRKIVNNTPYKVDIGTNKPTIRYYHFKEVYGSSNSQNNSSSNNRGSSWGNEIGNKLGKAAEEGFGIPQEGYPNLQIRAGASFMTAEFISLKAELGGVAGFVLGGGVGKSLFDNSIQWKSWFANVGYYGGTEEFCFSFNTELIKNGLMNDYLLMLELEFSYFFGGSRFGVFVDAELGGAITAEKFVFNLGGGIAWKLFSE